MFNQTSMTTVKRLIFLVSISICMLSACKKDDVDEKLAKEDQELDQYMADKPNAVRLADGLYIEKLPMLAGGVQPEAGDFVLVDYVCKYLYTDITESVSYENYSSYGALYPCVYKSGGPELWELFKPLFGISMGIAQMSEHQTANIYITSRTYNQDFNTRLFEMTLRKVIGPDLKGYQETLMSTYLKRQYADEVDSVKITNNGKEYYMMYHIVTPGTEGVVGATNTQTTESYFLQNNDIRLCGSGERIWNNGNMIQVLKQVNKGGRVVVAAPYKLIYGDDEYYIMVGKNKQYIAPPGSVLLYDITIE